jgi:hypothetical protein
VQAKIHVSFRNLGFVTENITSELAETHTLMVRQHVQSTTAHELAAREVSCGHHRPSVLIF